MSPRRTFLVLFGWAGLVVPTLAGAQPARPEKTGSATATSAHPPSGEKAMRSATPVSPKRAKKGTRTSSVGSRARTTSGAASKAADCDVPPAQAAAAAKAPVPVAADPLAPTVAPCPPGASGAGKP